MHIKQLPHKQSRDKRHRYAHGHLDKMITSKLFSDDLSVLSVGNVLFEGLLLVHLLETSLLFLSLIMNKVHQCVECIRMCH